ncbi:hypothetical protein JW935_00970 [candidate division KSB1 bacterium]|nr:hypothetical protein [candidate division KSB1 bacterium]
MFYSTNITYGDAADDACLYGLFAASFNDDAAARVADATLGAYSSLISTTAETAADNATYAAAHAFDVFKGQKIIRIDIISLLLQSVHKIKKNENNKQVFSTTIYGPIWKNFQNALAAEGCAYWGRLYQKIFDDGLVVDLEAVETRLNVPKEFRDQGAATVANYLEELEEKGGKQLNEARIIILGDKGAGKTCLARRLRDPDAPMTLIEESTAGVNTSLWKLKKGNINIRIWDFAGHTVTHAVHQFFLSERCLYIIVYDGRTEERNRLEYWLNHMKNYGGDSRAFILVNKKDHHPVIIPVNSLKDRYPIEGVYTFSIGDDKDDLELFRDKVAEYIKNNPSWNKQKIPVNYFRVKSDLEALFKKGEKKCCNEHISRNEFDKIAEKHDVENSEQLLQNLHALGVSLWYKEMEEFNTLILNPEWISHGVYKIINWVNEEKQYTLTLSDFLKVFKDDKQRFPEEKHGFLFKLMKYCNYSGSLTSISGIRQCG